MIYLPGPRLYKMLKKNLNRLHDILQLELEHFRVRWLFISFASEVGIELRLYGGELEFRTF